MVRLPLVLAVLLSLVAGPVRAAGGSDAPSGWQAELAGMWTAYCLERFPDDARIDAFARSQGAKPMTPADVRSYLHDDPGRGWYLRTALGLYGITIEHPPIRACAVRHMTPNGVSTVDDFLAMAKEFARTRPGKVVPVPEQHSGARGLDITLRGLALSDVPGHATEIFIVLLTDYHGRAPDPWRADAMGGTGVEMRYVRQLPQ